VGDPLYVAGGGPNPDGAAVPGDGGYFLHAERICFNHPSRGENMDFHARVPEELRMQSEQVTGTDFT
jgi:23S rRNA pseudouridine1911/1915/1917 synthase